MSDLTADLRTVPLLAGLDDALLQRIAAVVTTETIDPGEALVTEGSVGADLYFVRRGTFVVTVRDGNADAEVGRLGPGDVVGETQLIAGGRRTAVDTRGIGGTVRAISGLVREWNLRLAERGRADAKVSGDA